MKKHYTSMRAVVVVMGVLALGACDNMNTTQQRTLSGAGIGAATGAVAGAVTGGSVGTGALIGTAVGAGAGYVYDQSKK